MLRLPDLGRVPRPTRTFLRLVVPHFALVFFVAIYLIFGAQVFCYLERPNDQRLRAMAKIRLNREIRQLTALVWRKPQLGPTSTFTVASTTDRLSSTDTTPSFDESTTTRFETDMTSMNIELEEGSGSGSGSGSSEMPVPNLFLNTELDRIDRRNDIEKKLFALLQRWEDAIRSYDIRASHLFTEEFLIDSRWDATNVTKAQLDHTESRWTLSASILFAFTIISTIGYGNLTPSTFWGRLFCIFYGLIGIPLTMLAIANIGRFLSEAADMLVERIRRERAYRRVKSRTALVSKRRASRLAGQFFQEVVKREDIDLKPWPPLVGHLSLLTFWTLYIFLGALCLPLWEDMNFFDGCYFSFVTITTVGFGDIVPKRYDYLFPTLVYITVGLAITTLAIEIFGTFLRHIHYLGSKIKGAKNVLIWFGSKMLTVQELVTAIGRQYGIPQGEIESLNSNLDQMIKKTVEHKEEEIRFKRASTRRRKAASGRRSRDDSKSAPLFADYEFRYIDEDSLAGTPLYKDRFILWQKSQTGSKD